MAVKEKLKKAGIAATAIAGSSLGTAGVQVATLEGSLPFYTALGVGAAGGVIAGRQLIKELKKKDPCVQAFIEYRDIKTGLDSYEHECKYHKFNPKDKAEVEEAKKKVFVLLPQNTKFDPCNGIAELKRDVAERKAIWFRECQKVV